MSVSWRGGKGESPSPLEKQTRYRPGPDRVLSLIATDSEYSEPRMGGGLNTAILASPRQSGPKNASQTAVASTAFGFNAVMTQDADSGLPKHWNETQRHLRRSHSRMHPKTEIRRKGSILYQLPGVPNRPLITVVIIRGYQLMLQTG